VVSADEKEAVEERVVEESPSSGEVEPVGGADEEEKGGEEGRDSWCGGDEAAASS